MRRVAAVCFAAASLFLVACAATADDDLPLHHWRERGFDSKAECYDHHRRIGGDDMTASSLRWWCGE